LEQVPGAGEWFAPRPDMSMLVVDPKPDVRATELVAPLPDGYGDLPAPAPTLIVRCEGGAVVADGGYVFARGGELLRESLPRREWLTGMDPLWADVQRELAGTTSPSGSTAPLMNIRSANYFHWWVDSVARGWLLEEWLGADRPPLALPGAISPMQSESLELLGLDELHVLSKPIERFREVVFTSGLAYGAAQAVSPLIGRFGEWCRARLGLEAGPEPRERLWVSRGGARDRRLLNEDEVVSFLEGYGIRPVDPGALEVSEQARLFARAELVIGGHGAGLTNILFCAPGSVVLELFAEGVQHASCYQAMCRGLALPYGSATGVAESAPGPREDFTVPLEALGAIVEAGLKRLRGR